MHVDIIAPLHYVTRGTTSLQQKTTDYFANGILWCLHREAPFRSEVVDLVSKNWNQLHSWVFEASEAILGGRESENSFILAKQGISK